MQTCLAKDHKNIKLHAYEARLIASLRGMKKGIIDRIKIQDGLPVYFNINFEGRDISGEKDKHKLND
jgi:hypothetical protein